MDGTGVARTGQEVERRGGGNADVDVNADDAARECGIVGDNGRAAAAAETKMSAIEPGMEPNYYEFVPARMVGGGGQSSPPTQQTRELDDELVRRYARELAASFQRTGAVAKCPPITAEGR